MNELMINLLLKITKEQLVQLFEDSEIDLKTEKIISILKTKENEDGVKVEFSYRSGPDLFTHEVSVVVEDNELHLEF